MKILGRSSQLDSIIWHFICQNWCLKCHKWGIIFMKLTLGHVQGSILLTFKCQMHSVMLNSLTQLSNLNNKFLGGIIIWPIQDDRMNMTENITPTNINRWNMTENVRQRLTITGEYDRIKNNIFFTSFLLFRSYSSVFWSSPTVNVP